MRYLLFWINVLALSVAVGCTTSKMIKEKCVVLESERENGLSFRKLKNQEHLVNQQGPSRGIIDGLIPLAANGVKTLIDNRKKRYTAEFSMAINDLHFYNNLSTNGVFDPNGIIFKGFTLVRLAVRKNSTTMDTALIAHFLLDTANSYEIANNSMFRLKLDSLDYRFPKAKFKNSNRKMNIDFEITFSTSFVNDAGNFFSNAALGKFYFTVRNAPINRLSDSYSSYYAALRNMPATGSCFIVPRSFGHYVAEDNELKPSYSWGNFSISATIKESSKQSFVDKIITDNSSTIMNATKTGLQKATQKIQ
jgi:hypothetical protein